MIVVYSGVKMAQMLNLLSPILKDIINLIKCNLKKINECFSSTFFWIASYIVRRDEKCIAFGSW